MTRLAWVLESDVFPDSHERLRSAVLKAGLQCVEWSDEWWVSGRWPHLESALFHGSLGNAARIRESLPWRPGSFCATDAFRCTRWYPRASQWLLHRSWANTTVEALVASPMALEAIGAPEQFFVRPDSPLKPFSGRILQKDAVTLKALDHGFYYDDASLPVVVTPVVSIGAEWRYVVVHGAVVAGCAYQADGRVEAPGDPGGSPWRFAAEVAAALDPPEPVYVLDVCESGGDLRLVELNPFSGADLYSCDRAAVVASVSAAVGAS